LAFKTVYNLEMKRRHNEKKVIALYDAMKDMVGVLLCLKGVENVINKNRLELLSERTAKYIKECSNVCDTYVKRGLLSKVIFASTWDTKLLGFMQLFGVLRRKFVFELSIHTSKGVDMANDKLDVFNTKSSFVIIFS